MKITGFLKNNIGIIIFYFVFSGVTNLLFLLDPSKNNLSENLSYLNIIILVFTVLYLLFVYLKNRNYYKIIDEIIKTKKEDIHLILPEAENYDQELFNEIIKIINLQNQEKINEFISDKSDYRDFITSWVHEIKTPIAAAGLIIENSSGKNGEEIADRIEEELEKINNYVEQVLYYSRLDAFNRDYLINEYSADEIIKECVKNHARIFIAKRIKIELQNLDFSILTDKKWIEYVFSQIISNSLKYTRENGVISITGEKTDSGSYIKIRDNGAGIKPEDIERIFEKGFTGYNGRMYGKSTGMGLYLAKNLAIKLGHDIKAESVYGEYTEVTVCFPKINDYNRIK